MGTWSRAFFALAAVLICLGTAASLEGERLIRRYGAPAHSLLDLVGVSAAFGVAYLCLGMWFYWSNFDKHSKLTKTLWLLIFLIGIWYGAILYFLVVFLPGYSQIKAQEK
jgi:phosphotransferase system  glucose/maltose/N-acetylglucosamine-specific IIC component